MMRLPSRCYVMRRMKVYASKVLRGVKNMIDVIQMATIGTFKVFMWLLASKRDQKWMRYNMFLDSFS